MSANGPIASVGPGSMRLLLAGTVVYDHFFGLKIGEAAVYLFFVLSGFWIHRVWRGRYSQTCNPYLTFLASRLWRLLPVMLAASVTTLFVKVILRGQSLPEVLPGSPLHLAISNALLIGYDSLPAPRLVQPAWSLDIEMQFYLVAPLVAAALAWLGTRRFVVVCAALVVLDWTLDLPPALTMLGWFVAGTLASSFSWRPPPRLVQISQVGSVGLIFLFAFTDLRPIVFDSYSANYNALFNVALATIATPVVLQTCFTKPAGRDNLYGNLSYVLYLFHWPVLIAARTMQAAHPWSAAEAMVIAFGLSLAVWHGFDRPIQRQRSRWVARRKEMTSAVPAALPTSP